MSDTTGFVIFNPTNPFDTTLQDEYRYYHNSMPNARVIRTDGHIINFLHGMYRTNVVETIEYLDREIKKNALPGISFAAPEQISAFRMKLEPATVILEDSAVRVVESAANRITEGLLRDATPSQREVLEQLFATLDSEDILKQVTGDVTNTAMELDQVLNAVNSAPGVTEAAARGARLTLATTASLGKNLKTNG